jgi:hypothetical protein
MIRELRKQNNDTLFQFLTRVGQDRTVYSCCPLDLYPTVEDEIIYVYIQKQEVTIVMIDQMPKGTKERADLHFQDPNQKSRFRNVTTQLHRKKRSRRISPVWQLFHAAVAMEELINKRANERVNVHGVLITQSIIINGEELAKAFNEQPTTIDLNIFTGITTFHDQWSVLKLPLNDDDSMAEAQYLRIFKEELDKRDAREDEVDKEFEEMLLKFIEEMDNDETKDDDSGFDDSQATEKIHGGQLLSLSPMELKRKLILQAKLAVVGR